MGNGGEGRVQIEFPFDLNWYNEQPCTQFRSLEHRKEPKGFQHEFIVLKLEDGSVCRMERMGDRNARFDALSSHGSVAHDVAQCYRPENIEGASLNTSEIVTEIVFPRKLDLIDVLKICRAIHEGEKTRNYTLLGFNCYFFSLAIQCCLARLVTEWEKIIPHQVWLSALDKALGCSISTHRTSRIRRHKQPCFARIYSVLNPNDPWSIKKLLQKVQTTIRNRSKLGGQSEYALSSVLWHADLRTELSRLAQDEIKLTSLQVLRARLDIRLGEIQPSSLAPAIVAMTRETLPSDATSELLRAHCMAALIELVELAHPGPSRELPKTGILQSQTQPPRHPTTQLLRGRIPSKMDYRGNPVQPAEVLTRTQRMLICRFYLEFTLYWLLSLAIEFLWVAKLTVGPEHSSCIIIDNELKDMVSELERPEQIGANELTKFLCQLRALCETPCATWDESPWDHVCKEIKEHFISNPPIKQEAAILQVRKVG